MILDLTREVKNDTKVFPGSPLPKFITWTKMDVHNYVLDDNETSI